MATDVQRHHRRIGYLLLINLIAAIALPALFAPFGGIIDYLLALFAGWGVLALVDRGYFRFTFWLTVYLLYLIYEIIVSSLNVAWLVLQPRPKFDPGIVAVPLTVTTGLEITLLASAITLAPGSFSIDLQRGADGKFILFVHALRVGDPDEFRSGIKQGLERIILRISRGVDQL